MQRIITIEKDYLEFEQYIKVRNIKRIFLVSGKSAKMLPIQKVLGKLQGSGRVDVHVFSDYQPNPTFDSVVNGVMAYKRCNADCIMAIGGGSAIDVAKCIKAYAYCDDGIDYTEQLIEGNEIPFIVMPTTAGTGSEATHFAVIYKDGNKLSVAHESLVPEVVIMDAANLESLPLYQKVVTMLDAWCHAIEASWSLRANEESDGYVAKALNLIMKYQDAYLQNERIGNRQIQQAAYFAGKAINITQTTAAHAMSYKLTSLYKLPHGHAVAICLSRVWKNIIENCDQKEISDKLEKINSAMNCDTAEEAISVFDAFLERHNIGAPKCSTEMELDMLKHSVNQQRLKNYPIHLKEEEIEELYRKILGWESV